VAARLFSVADFRRLWLLGLVLCVVRWLEMLVFALYAYRITGSPFIVALLPMLRLLPLALFGAFVGAAAERFERRRALVLVVALSMATTLALGILASLGAIEIWHLALGSFINGIGWAADHPVRRMMIGDAVGLDQVGPALSLDTATNNGTRLVGPTLGGFLLAQFGVASVFWFDFALFALGLFAVLRLGRHKQTHSAATGSILASVREGLAWVVREKRLIGVFSTTVVFNVFGWPFTSMVPVIGTDTLGLDPKGIGIVAGCEGVGGLLGALAIASVSRPAWYGRIYVGAVTLYLVAVIGFALSSTAPLAAFFVFAAGMCGAGFGVMQGTLVYRSAPVEMRARLLGVVSVCIGTAPLGFLYLGFLADVLTPSIGMVALGVQGLLAMLLTRPWWQPALRL
jgi:MFS family permease